MAPALRIATYNIESFGSHHDASLLERRIERLRPALAAREADILCLQEVDASHPPADKHGPRVFDALDRLLAGTAYAAFDRAHTESRTGGARDRHNLLVLSRFPIVRRRQVWHDIMPAPGYRGPQAPGVGETAPGREIAWDRPFLLVTIDAPGNPPRPLHILHLRAPRAAYLPGGKRDAYTWNTMQGWAEGFFVAAVKQVGQALGARLCVDRLFDEDPDAWIAVLGDFNAEQNTMALKLLAGDAEDAGNARLAGRMLTDVAGAVEAGRRFSTIHRGRPALVDHVLASPALMRHFHSVAIANEGLADDAADPDPAITSTHAAVVAAFDAEQTTPHAS